LQEQYGQFRQTAVSHGAARPALNARAEELKAQLMKIKERGKSGTPPVATSASNPSRSKETIAPVQESSKISSDDTTTAVLHPSGVIDEDLNDLISEAKAAAHIEKGKKQSDLTIARPPQPSSSQSAKKYTVAVAEDSSAKVSKQAIKNPNSHEKLLRKEMNSYNKNEVLSDASEGEIQKRSKADTSRPPSGPKESRISTKQNKETEQVLRKSRDEESGKTRQNRENRETSPHRGGATRASAPQFHDNRNNEADERPMRNVYPSNNRYERNHQPEADNRSYSKRDTRDSDEQRRKQESKHISDREEEVVRKSEAPTLAQLLTLDEDLREWLDITRYHDVEYRTKTLNRRRAIAALDAQKAKLLAEMEIEERGGLQTTTNSQTTVSGMLPPPIPSKMSTNTSSSAVAPSSKKDDDLPIRSGQERSSSTSINQETALKRTYSEYRESQDKVSADKIGRIDEQGRGIRIKSEHQTEEHPGSSDYDSTRRCSPSPDYRSGGRGKRDTHSETHSRDQRRSFSHHRDMSPGELAYEKRPRARSRSYEFPSPDEQNRVGWKDPEYVPRGTYVERGNYRGRAYDPNYRGRGGGRGRGKTWNELGEARFEQRDASQIQSHGNRLASLKPYKDPNPLDKGGKGGQ
jgi:YTH domain-containing protein 1